MNAPVLFSTINVTRQVFHRTALSFAIVNIKPIVPGHVLVIPSRPVPVLADLTHAELSALMISVQQVGNVVKRAYNAEALTIACQDGAAAGQSIPHVHFHLLPRKLKNDRFEKNNDDIYPVLENHEIALRTSLQQAHELSLDMGAAEPLRMDADESRLSRTLAEMEKEARFLEQFFVDSNST